MASLYNSRKFNLIPPKTKEEAITIQERDNTFFYSFILIFCAIVVFFFLTIAEILVIQPRIAADKQNAANIASEISAFDSLKAVHGELFVKSQALDSILGQDIKLTQLLDISDQLKATIPDSLVVDYSRETSGQFVVDLRLDSYSDVSKIFTNSQAISVLQGLNLRSVSTQNVNGTTYIIAQVGFNITNITNDNGGN